MKTELGKSKRFSCFGLFHLVMYSPPPSLSLSLSLIIIHTLSLSRFIIHSLSLSLSLSHFHTKNTFVHVALICILFVTQRYVGIPSTTAIVLNSQPVGIYVNLMLMPQQHENLIFLNFFVKNEAETVLSISKCPNQAVSLTAPVFRRTRLSF